MAWAALSPRGLSGQIGREERAASRAAESRGNLESLRENSVERSDYQPTSQLAARTGAVITSVSSMGKCSAAASRPATAVAPQISEYDPVTSKTNPPSQAPRNEPIWWLRKQTRFRVAPGPSLPKGCRRGAPPCFGQFCALCLVFFGLRKSDGRPPFGQVGL